MRVINKDNLIDLCHIMADKCDGLGESIWNQFATTVEWCVEVDAVEVVRCGECKLWDTDGYGVEFGDEGFGWCDHNERTTDKDWFCADGRKGEEDDCD